VRSPRAGTSGSSACIRMTASRWTSPRELFQRTGEVTKTLTYRFLRKDGALPPLPPDRGGPQWRRRVAADSWAHSGRPPTSGGAEREDRGAPRRLGGPGLVGVARAGRPQTCCGASPPRWTSRVGVLLAAAGQGAVGSVLLAQQQNRCLRVRVGVTSASLSTGPPGFPGRAWESPAADQLGPPHASRDDFERRSAAELSGAVAFPATTRGRDGGRTRVLLT